MALTAGLATNGLDELSLWLDEATSWYVAQLDWARPWDAIREEGALYMSLYFALLGPWLSLGESEAVIRGFSVLWAVASIPMIYVLGRELLGDQVGAIAALLLGINAFLIQFAQEARSYTLLIFLTTASSYLLVKALARPRWPLLSAYAVVAAASLYAHFFAAFVVAAHFAVTVLATPRKVWGPMALAFAGVAALAAPLVTALVTDASGGLSWIGRPVIGEVGVVWSRLTGQGTILPVLYACFVVVVLWQVIRARRHRSPAWRYGLIVVGIALPLAGAYLLSHVRPMFQDRYLTIILPFVALAAATALAALENRVVVAAAVVATSLLHLQGTTGYFENYAKEDWRGVVAYVLGNQAPGDGIAFYSPYVRQPFEYYVRSQQATTAAPEPIYPTPPWGSYGPGLGTGAPLTSALDDAGSTERIWLVEAHAFPGPDKERLEDWLAESYHHRSTEHFAGTITVQLFERHSGPDSPRISRQPVSQVAEWGASVRFEVGATGEPPLRYAWTREGERLAGETGSTLTVVPVGPNEQDVQYRCVVSNRHGQTACSPASLMVAEPVATYEANPPSTWQPAESLTYDVVITNRGAGTWRAAGPGMVRLGIHFGGLSDEPGAGWLTDQRFALPGDVEPGESVRLVAPVTAPDQPGRHVLRHRMVVEGVAWFPQLDAASVDVRQHVHWPILVLAGVLAAAPIAFAMYWIRKRWADS